MRRDGERGGVVGLRAFHAKLVVAQGLAPDLEVVEQTGEVLAVAPVGLADLQHAAISTEDVGELLAVVVHGYQLGVDVQLGGCAGNHDIDVLPVGVRLGVGDVAGGIALAVVVVVAFDGNTGGLVEHADVVFLAVLLLGGVGGGEEGPASVAGGIGLDVVADGHVVLALEQSVAVLGGDVEPEVLAELRGLAVLAVGERGGALRGARRIAAVEGLAGVLEGEVGEQIRVGRLGFAGHGHLGGHGDGGGAV